MTMRHEEGTSDSYSSIVSSGLSQSHDLPGVSFVCMSVADPLVRYVRCIKRILGLRIDSKEPG